MPITADNVAAWMKSDIPPDDAELARCVQTVNELVTSWHGEQWPPGADTGAVMLAARLHRRRNSPGGVESFGEAGAAYIPRYDADLDRLLRINDWAVPQVG
ncbi:hypothetical protein [Corynebacterium auriscanis]|uniref:hypothetical protein n=1 Tax=Corynebacterium auriscanis TaxID=99807 RepID=UPI0024ADA955|nr:hypothetical protein [Corynebacterium auriscanis]